MEDMQKLKEKEEIRERILGKKPKEKITFFRSYVMPYISLFFIFILLIGILGIFGVINPGQKISGAITAEPKPTINENTTQEKNLNITEINKSSLH